MSRNNGSEVSGTGEVGMCMWKQLADQPAVVVQVSTNETPIDAIPVPHVSITEVMTAPLPEGTVCRDYLKGQCTPGCRYIHLRHGYRPIPEQVCHLYHTGHCPHTKPGLGGDRCKYFHGEFLEFKVLYDKMRLQGHRMYQGSAWWKQQLWRASQEC